MLVFRPMTGPIIGVIFFVVLLFGGIGAWVVHYNNNIKPKLPPPSRKERKNIQPGVPRRR
jgi:hypothetical protein